MTHKYARPAAMITGAIFLALAIARLAARPSPPSPSTPVEVPSASASRDAAEDCAYPEWNSVPNEALPPASELRPGTLRILVVGDSVAKFLGNSMRFRQETALAYVAQRGVGSCSIHLAADGSSCATHWVSDVTTLHPDVTFVVLGGGFLGPRTCERDWRSTYAARLRDLTRTIAADAGRIVLALVPYPGERWRTPLTLASVRCFDDELARVAKTENAETLDLLDHVCPTTDCIQTSDGWPVRNDGLHFDGPGSFETADWTLAELRRIAERDR